jgi:hypothetical protein
MTRRRGVDGPGPPAATWYMVPQSAWITRPRARRARLDGMSEISLKHRSLPGQIRWLAARLREGDASHEAVALALEVAAQEADEAVAPETVTVPRCDFDHLLAVATIYVGAFGEDEMMTLPEKLRLQEVEAILERHGKRY